MFRSLAHTFTALTPPGSKKCAQARSGGLGIDFGAYFCKELCQEQYKDAFSCHEFLPPLLLAPGTKWSPS